MNNTSKNAMMIPGDPLTFLSPVVVDFPPLSPNPRGFILCAPKEKPSC